MKRAERKFMDTFNDRNLALDLRFKRGLKEAMMKKANKQPTSEFKKPFVLIASGVAAIALLFVAAQLLSSGQESGSGNGGNNVAIPFTPKTASAAQIEQQSRAAMEKNKSGDVPLLIRTERLEKGTLYEACNTGGMGAQPGETVEYYAYHSKDSDVEALYQVVRGETTRDFSFYSKGTSQLSGALDAIVGYPFSLETEYYTQVDAQGNSYSGDVTSRQENGKNVFHVYAKATNGGETCQGRPVIIDFTVDAESYVQIENARYAGSVGEQNLISRYATDLETRNLSEKQALSAMEKAGFDRAGAVSTLPSYFSL